MLLPRAAPAAACTAVNGGATTISTAAVSLTNGRRSVTNATVSPTVLNIFQLPAIRGVRISDPVGGMGPSRLSCLSCRVCLVRQSGHSGERLAAEEFQRGAAAG